MRKLVKLMTISTIAATTALQVTACSDDSKYKSFMSDVSESANNSTAFFGFLGTADDDISEKLQTSFDFLNNPGASNGQSLWQQWINGDAKEYLKSNELNNIYLRYYQGPYHQDKPSDPVNSFWNDKNISWQQNIFNWVHTRANKDNPSFKIPGGVNEVTPIVTKKDDSKQKKDMFTALPIVFIISKGKLITAGQNWIPANSSRDAQINAIKNFVLNNLFLPS